jgi:hypothetical protein
VAETLYTYAKDLGFNEREAEDVVEYFISDLEDSPYVYISHLSERETKQLLDFEVSPKPNVQETRMFYLKKLVNKQASSPSEPIITPIHREGLTVVTWGGIVE